MTEMERQLVVGLLLSLVLATRLLGHRQAGGLFRDQSDGMVREGGTAIAVLLRVVFLLGGVGALVVWAGWPAVMPGNLPLPPWAHGVGVILAHAGTILLVWVHIALGVQFSGTLHLRDDHQLVQHGPYATVRHPMNTAFLLFFAGMALLTGNLWIGSIGLGSQVWTIGWRLRAEEASLAERFGDAWACYRARTGQLTPWF